VREVVLDASVLLKWFHSEGEEHVQAARDLRLQFEAGELQVFAPALLWLEVINVAARRWRWGLSQLEQLAGLLPRLGFMIADPELHRVARWCGMGLTAYDAAYVALAEQTAIELITADRDLCRVAAPITTFL
jgi:predicted nucleic acid-binding protein